MRCNHIYFLLFSLVFVSWFSCSNSENKDPDQEEFIKDPRAVDLGLSVYWADRNIGASIESEVGSMYAWGETSTKSSYTKSNYTVWSNLEWSSVPESISGTEFDAAKVNWGGKWRMPTTKEVSELFAKCVVTHRTINGKQGAYFQNNGKSVFIPCPAIRTGDKDKEHDHCSMDIPIIGFDKTLEGQEYIYGVGFICERTYKGTPIRPVMEKQ